MSPYPEHQGFCHIQLVLLVPRRRSPARRRRPIHDFIASRSTSSWASHSLLLGEAEPLASGTLKRRRKTLAPVKNRGRSGMKPSNMRIDPQKGHTFLDRRRDAERAPMYCRVTYAREEGDFTYIAEGLLRDLSKIGCGIRGRNPPAVGSQITLTLYLQDRKPPLCLVGTIVSWVAGDFFGAKFPQLTVEERNRVQQHIWSCMK